MGGCSGSRYKVIRNFAVPGLAVGKESSPEEFVTAFRIPKESLSVAFLPAVKLFVLGSSTWMVIPT